MHTSKPNTYTQALPITIHVDRFQPFSSRHGLDEVVRLQFDYDPALVSRFKAILAVYAVGASQKIVGGWLPEHRAWFVEQSVWEVVRMELLYLGHRVKELAA